MSLQAAIAAAAARQQAALADAFAGIITIAGEDYDAAIVMEPIKPEQDGVTGTWNEIQRGEVRVKRSLMAEPPSGSVKVTVDALSYRILTIDQSDPEVWVFKLFRKVK